MGFLHENSSVKNQLYTTTGVAKVLVLVCQEKMTKSDSSSNFKNLAHPRPRDFYLTSSLKISNPTNNLVSSLKFKTF